METRLASWRLGCISPELGQPNSGWNSKCVCLNWVSGTLPRTLCWEMGRVCRCGATGIPINAKYRGHAYLQNVTILRSYVSLKLSSRTEKLPSSSTANCGRMEIIISSIFSHSCFPFLQILFLIFCFPCFLLCYLFLSLVIFLVPYFHLLFIYSFI